MTAQRSQNRLVGREVLLITLLGVLVSCNGDSPEGRDCSSAAMITLKLTDSPSVRPITHEKLRRSPVLYDHAAHVSKLGKDECELCHQLDPKEKLVPLFRRRTDPDDRTALMELYHAECMACHEQRSGEGKETGPLTCGECHMSIPQIESAWREVHFDYSLHYKHVRAEKNKCESCHHIYDEVKRELVYRKNQESACGDCHLQWQKDDIPSLRMASHADCISCHMQRYRENVKGGPFLCAGCHDEKRQKGFEPELNIPRLGRGQPDMTWIGAPGASARMVSFNHREHEREKASSACSDCHHKTLKACDECHKIGKIGDDGAVSLETAYHDASSKHSCVGCHALATSEKSCSGCHYFMSRPPSDSACTKCHDGPAVDKQPPPPEPIATTMEFDLLPPAGEEFPESIKIDKLSEQYRPSLFPHRKIAVKLDEAIRRSGLAKRFHSYPETLCIGCHHNTPVDARPAACGSCHDDRGLDSRDKPDLFTAYHRQCVGCHQRMDLKQQDCTDCHEKVAVEDSK